MAAERLHAGWMIYSAGALIDHVNLVMSVLGVERMKCCWRYDNKKYSGWNLASCRQHILYWFLCSL